jgi:hypothetical protein
MLARLEGWVESWNRVKGMPEDQLQDYLMKKCRNGFQMAKKPSRAQRDAWVTILAEPDKGRHELSPLAMRMVDHVRQRAENVARLGSLVHFFHPLFHPSKTEKAGKRQCKVLHCQIPALSFQDSVLTVAPL